MKFRPAFQFRFRDEKQYGRAKALAQGRGVSLNEFLAVAVDVELRGSGRRESRIRQSGQIDDQTHRTVMATEVGSHEREPESAGQSSDRPAGSDARNPDKSGSKPRKAKEVALTTSERLKQMREGE